MKAQQYIKSLKHPIRLSLITLVFVVMPTDSLSQEVGFVPKLGGSIIRDNNIYRTEKKRSDNIALIKPQVIHTILYGKQQIRTEYKGNYAFYTDNSQLNFFEHDTSVKALLDHSYKLNSEFFVGYKDGVEEAGTTNAATTQLNEFNQRASMAMAGKVFYGTVQSTGQVVLGYAYDNLRFSNNQQQFRNYDRDKVTSTLFYRVAPKARMLLEASAANLRYKNTQDVDRSNQKYYYLAGVELNSSTAINSVFKVGYQNVAYESELFAEQSGLSYFVDLYWKPKSYALIKLNANRQAKESAEQSIGGFLSHEYKLGIEYDFSTETELTFEYGHTNYEFDNTQKRNDKSQGLEILMTHQPKYWLQLQVGFKVVKRESTLDIYEFDASALNIGVEMSFN